ncbi:hypothetical protein [Synechocystis sp. LKSZ1]|uniref:hypothetical protein n=1 Tax=Synechocystis sp. LKSZ1 TaxID=3144951 RepID=UPI00336C28BD
MRKIYVIGVGGSGAKCIETVVFLHALGVYGNSRLGVLLIDADAANGNSQRTQINLQNTLDCHRLLKPHFEHTSGFMTGEFENYGTWNPLGNVVHNSNLSRIFNRPLLKASAGPLAQLFDVLYSPDEQAADLAVGFRGRPPIGSAVMSRLDLENTQATSLSDNWQKFFNHIQSDCGGGDKVAIHLFGSIFGGTGASGVPTLAALISNQLRANQIRDSVHLNASLLLPYFGFDRPDDGDQTVFAETSFFALNTQAALQYLTEHSQGIFDTVYLIGNQERKKYEPSTGGVQQQNDAHFVELYAGLAINNGFEQPIEKTQAAYISRSSTDRLLWKDLPDSDLVKERLSKGVRFTYSWYYNFALELAAAQRLGPKKFAKGAPWFPRFFSLKKTGEENLPAFSEENQKRQADALEQWARSFLIWAKQIAQSHHQGEQLFRLQSLVQALENSNTQRQYGEKLGELVIERNQSAKAEQQDRLDTVKNRLADQGTKGHGVLGLAHELFTLL